VFTNEIIYQAPLTAEMLNDEALTKAWADEIVSILTVKEVTGTLYSSRIAQDEESQLFYPVFSVRQHGLDTEYDFTPGFFNSKEYATLTGLGIANLLEEGAYVKRGEKSREVLDFVEALNWLMAESKRGSYIQRYKGLGEMNPSQLWETTMDPETRRMLQVRIEDAVAADQLFTTLMGDHVEPRREFIEENALKVANLDF
jgi:DNA gyrase subunit B